MKKNISLIVLLTAGSILNAAEVIKISKNKMGMAVSRELGSEWGIGQRVCVQVKEGKKYCGKVVKVQDYGVLCQMTEALIGVSPGDEVSVEGETVEPDVRVEDPLESSSRENIAEKTKQEPDRKKSTRRNFGIGIRGGGVFSNISSDNPSLSNQDSRTAMNVGLAFDIPFGKGYVSFEPSLNYTSKGYKSSSDITTKLNYLELPLNFKIRFSRGGMVPFMYLGPYFSYLLSAKSSLPLVGDLDIKDLYKSIEFGFSGGVGFDFKVSPKFEIGLSGNYGLGLSNINNSGTYSTKNKTVQALLHLLFQL